MQCKEKDVYSFSCSINVTMTSQNVVPFFTCIKELICGGVIYTPKIILCYVRSNEMVKSVYRNAKMKILFNMDINFT